MTEFVNVPGATRPLSPQAIVLLDPATGLPESVSTGRRLANTLSATGTGATVLLQSVASKATTWTHSATVTGTGAVSATVVIEASNDTTGVTGWFLLCTLSPSGSTEATDALTGISASYAIRHRVTAVAGTSAVVAVTSCGA